MIKQLITIAFLAYTMTITLYAQEDTTEKWNKMKRINPNLRETTTIRIFDDLQQVYHLELKDNKPYNGYEISEDQLLGEYNFVNYYKDGERIAQYAIDFIAKDQFQAPYEYTLKTTFQNEKVLNGNLYNMVSQNILKTDQYENGKQNGFFIDLFAMHYFNRLSFQLKENHLTIHNMETNNELKVYKKDEQLLADYYVNGKLVATSKKIVNKLNEVGPHSSKVYYLGADYSLQEFICTIDPPVTIEDVEDQILTLLFAQFSFDFTGDLVEILATCNSFFNKNTALSDYELANLLSPYIIPYTEATYLSVINYDEHAQPQQGTTVKQLDTGKYEIMHYENGVISRTKTIHDLKELKAEE